ncbi:MAG: hypothetical protein ABR540_14890 [Acidimicrobiales bacterium]
MRRLWPVAEAAQADYETLRAAVLVGIPLVGPAAARFDSAGLLALIRRPVAEPDFAARLFAARRAPWTPYGDPRLDALAAAYELVLAADAAVEDRHERTGS